MNKHIRRLCFLFLGILLCSLACTPQPSTSNASPLKIGAGNWTGYSGHFVTMQKDFFTEQNIKAEAVIFQDFTAAVSAFLAGKIDLYWGASADVVELQKQDPSIRAIFLVDYSNGGDGILGRDINQPKDLKNKTVAFENLLLPRVLLHAYLSAAGMSEQNVVVKNMPVADAATAFASQRVDAAITSNPWLSETALRKNEKIVFSTKGTNLIADVIIARESLIRDRKADLVAYLQAVDKAVKLVKAGDPEAIGIVSKTLGVTPDEVKQQLTTIRLFDVEDNKTVGFNPDDPNNLVKNLELTAKVAYEAKIIDKPVDISSLYDDSIVQAVK